MTGLYPEDTKADSGEFRVGLHEGKFTNGDPSSGILPSKLPCETINLILDLLGEVIEAGKGSVDNQSNAQLKEAIVALSDQGALSRIQKATSADPGIPSALATQGWVGSQLQNALSIGLLYYGFMSWGFCDADKPPLGWVVCDGKTLNYATDKRGQRWKAFVDQCGADLISSKSVIVDALAQTISLPNFYYQLEGQPRGRFIRAGKGPERAIGSLEEDAFQGHFHRVSQSNVASGNDHGTLGPGVGESDAGEIITDGKNGIPRIANETRPSNIAMCPLLYLGEA